MGVAKFSITGEFLRKSISLPESTVIIGSEASDDGTIVVKVADRVIPEGKVLVEPKFHRDPVTGDTSFVEYE